MTDLFSPFEVRSLRLRNRFVMAPMTRQRSPDGVPTSENVEYYRARAAGGVGLVVTEGTYVRGPAAGPSLSVPRCYGSASADGWRRVVEAVHGEGAAIIPQLWHTGAARGDQAAFEPDQVSVSPSGIDLDGNPLGRALTVDELDAVVAAFVESARFACDVGFDGVELHAAHGYLLDEFLWDRTNRRDDDLGGSIEHRTSFPARVVAAVRHEVGPDVAVSFRFSQWKVDHYGARIVEHPDELARLLAPLAMAGVDVFHVSTRRHWVPGFDGPDRTSLAGWTKRLSSQAVMAVGSVGLSDPAVQPAQSAAASVVVANDAFTRGEFDLLALGRSLLADPAWVTKAQQGRWDDITLSASRPG